MTKKTITTFLLQPETRKNLENLIVRKCSWDDHFQDIYEFIAERIEDWVTANTRVMQKEEKDDE